MWQTLLSPSLSPSFIRRFTSEFAGEDNWHNLDLESADLGYGWVHYAFIRVLKPSRVLCIGSRYGFVPAVCALACKDNLRGKVDFVDAGYDEANPQHAGKHWGGRGEWLRPSAMNRFKRWQLGAYLSLYPMRTDSFFPKYPKRRWQYAHIDGDHSFKGASYDFKQVWKALDATGIVALHDINTPQSMGNVTYGVSKLWQSINKTKKNHFELPGVCGVGFVQKGA